MEEVNKLGLKHINYALVEKTRPMMYKAMKYWGKKPNNLFRAYIEHYSNPNEIVLDAFAGSGVCPLEAIQTGRKAIAVDLNPIAIFITKMLATPLDIVKFREEWVEINKDFFKFEKESGLFLTTCPRCKKKARIINVHYDGTPTEIRYKCSCEKKNKAKKLDEEDLKIIEKANKIKIDYWYPQDKFLDSDTFDGAKKIGDYFYDLWTKRNLYALAYIFDRINKVEDKKLKEFFRFAFISMLHLSTKMVSARQEKTQRPDSGSWGRPAYLFPKKHLEQNPFILFERAIEDRQGIIKAKESSNKLLDDKPKFAKDFEDLISNDKNLLILKKNSVELSKFIPSESVDFVLTDPPYGGLIKYFDLSSIWAIWLKGIEQNKDFEISYDEEVTLDKKRDFDYYDKMLYRTFSEVNKVLKTNRYLIVTFHNSQPRIFNSIMKSCINAGFVLEEILFQQNKRASESGVANPWGTAISDFYLRFRKPTKEEKKIEGLNREGFEKMVVNSAKIVLAKRGQPTEMTYIINGVYMELYRYGQYLNADTQQDITDILKKRLGKEFVLVEADEENIKKGERWWFSEEERQKHKLEIPLSDRVETAIIQTFHDKIKVSYDDILQTLFIKFPNSLTPDYNSINNLIEEYGAKQKDGTWMLKPNFKQDENKHILIERILAEIGKRFGYKIWCPDKNKDVKLKELCENRLEFDFDGKERVEKIDILWFKDKKIDYAFEVENSTTITSALERGSNLPDKDKIKKMILIPKERAKLLNRKIKEPMFKNTFILDKWRVASYEELEKLFKEKEINEESFEAIFSQVLKVKEGIQSKLS